MAGPNGAQKDLRYYKEDVHSSSRLLSSPTLLFVPCSSFLYPLPSRASFCPESRTPFLLAYPILLHITSLVMPALKRSLNDVDLAVSPQKRARLGRSDLALTNSSPSETATSIPILRAHETSDERKPEFQQSKASLHLLYPSYDSELKLDIPSSNPSTIAQPSLSCHVDAQASCPLDFEEAIFPPDAFPQKPQTASTPLQDLTKILHRRKLCYQNQWVPSAMGHDLVDFLVFIQELAQLTLKPFPPRQWTTVIPGTAAERPPIQAIFAPFSEDHHPQDWNSTLVILTMAYSFNEAIINAQRGVESMRRRASDRRFVLAIAFFCRR